MLNKGTPSYKARTTKAVDVSYNRSEQAYSRTLPATCKWQALIGQKESMFGDFAPLLLQALSNQSREAKKSTLGTYSGQNAARLLRCQELLIADATRLKCNYL